MDLSINNKRHTDFYIPVLCVLEDMKPHEINHLIEEVANLCQLSDEDRNVMTKGGSNKKYRSHIQWAVTDLHQGGFIAKEGRGVYKMSFDGMLMLEDKPERPTREYLAQKSEKFRDFCNRKGKRSRNKELMAAFEENSIDEPEFEDTVFEEISVAPKNVQNKENLPELNSLYELRDKMKELGLNTKEIEDKIDKVKSESILTKIRPVIQQTLVNLPIKENFKYVVVIDNASGKKPQAYIYSDLKTVNEWTKKSGSSLHIYDEKVTLPEDKTPKDTLKVEKPTIKKINTDTTQEKLVQKYINYFENIKIFDTIGIKGAHKAILLLAIFECVREGLFKTNQIYFNHDLERKYIKIWGQFFDSPLLLGMGYPFIQLKEEKFFHIVEKQPIKKIDQVWNRQKVLSHVKYGMFDNNLFGLLQDNKIIDKFEEVLVNRYCKNDDKSQEVKGIIENETLKAGGKIEIKKYESASDRIENFKHYLRTIQNTHGKLYSESTIGVYTSALSSSYITDKVKKYNSTGNIFDISDKDKVKAICNSVTADYTSHATHCTYKKAIELYLSYIFAHPISISPS